MLSPLFHERQVLRLLVDKICLSDIVLDLIDPQNIHGGAMPRTLLVALSALLLEDDHFFALAFFLDSRVHSRFLDDGATNRGVVSGSDEEHIIDADLLSDLDISEQVGPNPIVFNYLVLDA